MLKVIKKFEAEVVEVDGLVIVSVYPRPRCSLTEPQYRHPLDARVYTKLSDEDRAKFVSDCIRKGVVQLMEVTHDDY